MHMKNCQQRSKMLRYLANTENPLQIAGTINAYSALLAERAGFKAIYLSGAGVANASFGLPDLGITCLENVVEDTRRITQVSNLPLLVDADTGWDNTEHSVRQLSVAGAAGAHIEDQIDLKRCGHRDGKKLVSAFVMQERIKSAINGCDLNPDFVIMARTDAYSVEGLHASIDRAKAYVEAGAHMIFAEAYETLDEYEILAFEVGVPVLANITEFGKTDMFTTSELGKAGVSIALYPLTAFRVMNAAALNAYQVLRQQGTQAPLLSAMQTRMELYDTLDYEAREIEADTRMTSSKGASGE